MYGFLHEAPYNVFPVLTLTFSVCFYVIQFQLFIEQLDSVLQGNEDSIRCLHLVTLPWYFCVCELLSFLSCLTHIDNCSQNQLIILWLESKVLVAYLPTSFENKMS